MAKSKQPTRKQVEAIVGPRIDYRPEGVNGVWSAFCGGGEQVDPQSEFARRLAVWQEQCGTIGGKTLSVAAVQQCVAYYRSAAGMTPSVTLTDPVTGATRTLTGNAAEKHRYQYTAGRDGAGDQIAGFTTNSQTGGGAWGKVCHALNVDLPLGRGGASDVADADALIF